MKRTFIGWSAWLLTVFALVLMLHHLENHRRATALSKAHPATSDQSATSAE